MWGRMSSVRVRLWGCVRRGVRWGRRWCVRILSCCSSIQPPRVRAAGRRGEVGIGENKRVGDGGRWEGRRLMGGCIHRRRGIRSLKRWLWLRILVHLVRIHLFEYDKHLPLPFFLWCSNKLYERTSFPMRNVSPIVRLSALFFPPPPFTLNQPKSTIYSSTNSVTFALRGNELVSANSAT